MGLFERAGRRVEQFKQQAEAAADEQAGYECDACGKRLHTAHDACPDCGADAVSPIDSSSGSVSPASDETADEAAAETDEAATEPNEAATEPQDESRTDAAGDADSGETDTAAGADDR